MEEEKQKKYIDKITADLGANYKGDEEVLQDILDEVSSIAFDISHREDNEDNKKKLFPYIKRAVKAEYIARRSRRLNK